MEGSRLSVSYQEVKEVTVPAVDYRPDIDGLRAVAVIGVLVFHVNPHLLQGGYAGVDVFFVISGFLISGIVFRGLQRGSFSFRDFYARRIRRIFPALALVLLVTAAIGWLVLLPDEFEQLGRDMFAGATFLSNLSLYKDSTWYFALSTPLLHLWSLGVEEQFYLLWPLFLVCVWKMPIYRLHVILLATIVSFAISTCTIYANPEGSFYLPWNRLWELSLGASFASLPFFNADISSLHTLNQWLRRTRIYAPNQHIRGIVGTLLILGAFIGLDERVMFPGWWALVPTIGALLIISAGPTGWINKKLYSMRLIVFIGIISYPLYLWHWPLLALTRTYEEAESSISVAIGVALAAIGLAFITYKSVEHPCRASRSMASVVLVLCVSMAICAFLGFLTAYRVIPARSDFYDVAGFVRASNEDWLPNGKTMPGAHWVRWAHWTIFVDRLVIVGEGPRRTLFLGDSNMQHYFPRIDKLLSEHPHNGRGAVFAARSGCGPIVVDMLRPMGSGVEKLIGECRELTRRALIYARDQHVDTVVLSAHWYWYLVDATDGGKYSADRVLYDLKKFVLDLVKSGKRVYLILNIPRGDEFDPRKMIRRSLFSPAFRVSAEEPLRVDIVNMLSPVSMKLRQIAKETGATVIDPIEFLCGEVTCPVVTTNGEPMYKDGGHLRPSYVRDNARFLDETVSDN